MVKIYTTAGCPYGKQAIHWFVKRAIEPEVIHLTHETKRELLSTLDKTTVPQIFVNDVHIGGYSDLIKKEDEVLTLLQSS